MSFTDPLALFQAAVTAFTADDYVGVSRMCDPVTLRAFHRSLLTRFAPPVPRPTWTVDALLQASPGMPREVADYQVAQQQQYADPTRRLPHELPGVASVEVLQALDATQVFAAWLRGRSPRRMLDRAFAAAVESPELLSFATTLRRDLYDLICLGVVEDGPRVAYVLYRPRIDPSANSAREFIAQFAALPEDEEDLARESAVRHVPQLARCRRQADGTWLLYADHDFLSLGSTVFLTDSADVAESDDPDGRAS